MEQLKSSGLFRMIKNDSLAAQISDYYERMYQINEVGIENLRTTSAKVHDVYRQVFSYIDFEEMIQPDTSTLLRGSKSRQDIVSSILTRQPPLELYPADKIKFKQLYDAVAEWELALHSYNGRLRYGQDGANNLIKHIQEVYKFKDE